MLVFAMQFSRGVKPAGSRQAPRTERARGQLLEVTRSEGSAEALPQNGTEDGRPNPISTRQETQPEGVVYDWVEGTRSTS
jgi:hypothetical protein